MMLEKGPHEGVWVTCGIGGQWSSKNGTYYGRVDYKTMGQYTGLKDKKGYKIYEGDIIIISDSDIELNNISILDKYRKMPVRYIAPSFTLVDPEPYCDGVHQTFDLLQHGFPYCKAPKEPADGTILPLVIIVGNIYENPELLKTEVQKRV